MQLWQRISEARDVLWQAGVRIKEAKEQFEDYEIALIANTDYKVLGSNNDIRDQKLAHLLRQDEKWVGLRMYLYDAENRHNQLDMILNGLFDERRYRRSVQWAEMTEVLRGLVDRKGYAPRQVAEEMHRSAAEELMHRSLEQGVEDLPF